MSKKSLNEDFLKALGASKKRKGPRIIVDALEALGVNKKDLSDDIKQLKKFFPRGSTVFLILRKRSASGMQREIGMVALSKRGKDWIDLHPNYTVAKVLGDRLNKAGDGVVVRGAGMDMGMHLVSNLSYKLYGNEQALKYRWL